MAKKILIVEDYRFLREAIGKKLREDGFDVSEAVDGEEGLKKTKEEKPDLVLLDLILPGIGGFDVLAKIKEDATLNKVKVIVLSNLGQKEEIEKGMSLGANDYLVKANFTPREISEKSKKLLG